MTAQTTRRRTRQNAESDECALCRLSGGSVLDKVATSIVMKSEG